VDRFAQPSSSQEAHGRLSRAAPKGPAEKGTLLLFVGAGFLEDHCRPDQLVARYRSLSYQTAHSGKTGYRR